MFGGRRELRAAQGAAGGAVQRHPEQSGLEQHAEDRRAQADHGRRLEESAGGEAGLPAEHKALGPEGGRRWRRQRRALPDAVLAGARGGRHRRSAGRGHAAPRPPSRSGSPRAHAGRVRVGPPWEHAEGDHTAGGPDVPGAEGWIRRSVLPGRASEDPEGLPLARRHSQGDCQHCQAGSSGPVQGHCQVRLSEHARRRQGDAQGNCRDFPHG
mmetsp:Transcript_107414/g.331868  ORF Transcript_107414/g.331868 Transcript_107414/m.331868 type:complete len:212 (-) Transcript_107414:1831-2466(-)